MALWAIVTLALGGACSEHGQANAGRADAGRDLPPIDLALAVDGRNGVGGGCDDTTPCGLGLRCEPTDPAGRCTKACTADTSCGDARLYVCVAGNCRRGCDPRQLVDSCRNGYVCRSEGKRAACTVDCRVGGCAAKAGLICDAGSGLCVDPKGGKVGAPCGPKRGNCDGTPNGVCLAVDSLRPGFCTVPCAPFTKPCPFEFDGAACTLGGITATFCAFLCDPQKPKCPHPDLDCVTVSKDFHVCLAN